MVDSASDPMGGDVVRIAPKNKLPPPITILSVKMLVKCGNHHTWTVK